MKSILLLVATAVGAYAIAIAQDDVGELGGLRGQTRSRRSEHGKRDEAVPQVMSGTTTTTWDCCKPACGWPSIAGKAGATGSVKACTIDDQPISDPNAQGACQGSGDAYSCASFQPQIVNETFSYAFAGHGISASDVCCKCYQLTWTDGPAVGKSMIVQAVNSYGLPSADDLDLYVPGGGVGDFPDTCSVQYGAPHGGWGRQYGGVQSPEECDQLPANLKDGCMWQWTWGGGNLNLKKISYFQVDCPEELTDISGCSNEVKR